MSAPVPQRNAAFAFTAACCFLSSTAVVLGGKVGRTASGPTPRTIRNPRLTKDVATTSRSTGGAASSGSTAVDHEQEHPLQSNVAPAGRRRTQPHQQHKPKSAAVYASSTAASAMAAAVEEENLAVGNYSLNIIPASANYAATNDVGAPSSDSSAAAVQTPPQVGGPLRGGGRAASNKWPVDLQPLPTTGGQPEDPAMQIPLQAHQLPQLLVAQDTSKPTSVHQLDPHRVAAGHQEHSSPQQHASALPVVTNDLRNMRRFLPAHAQTKQQEERKDLSGMMQELAERSQAWLKNPEANNYFDYVPVDESQHDAKKWYHEMTLEYELSEPTSSLPDEALELPPAAETPLQQQQKNQNQKSPSFMPSDMRFDERGLEPQLVNALSQALSPQHTPMSLGGISRTSPAASKYASPAQGPVMFWPGAGGGFQISSKHSSPAQRPAHLNTPPPPGLPPPSLRSRFPLSTGSPQSTNASPAQELAFGGGLEDKEELELLQAFSLGGAFSRATSQEADESAEQPERQVGADVDQMSIGVPSSMQQHPAWTTTTGRDLKTTSGFSSLCRGASGSFDSTVRSPSAATASTLTPVPSLPKVASWCTTTSDGATDQMFAASSTRTPVGKGNAVPHSQRSSPKQKPAASSGKTAGAWGAAYSSTASSQSGPVMTGSSDTTITPKAPAPQYQPSAAAPSSRAGADGLPGRNDGWENMHSKTRICSFWMKGLCSRGSACGFAHGRAQLRQQPDLYKTKRCATFDRYGHCQAGENCRFAHGGDELRRPSFPGETFPHPPASEPDLDTGYNTLASPGASPPFTFSGTGPAPSHRSAASFYSQQDHHPRGLGMRRNAQSAPSALHTWDGGQMGVMNVMSQQNLQLPAGGVVPAAASSGIGSAAQYNTLQPLSGASRSLSQDLPTLQHYVEQAAGSANNGGAAAATGAAPAHSYPRRRSNTLPSSPSLIPSLVKSPATPLGLPVGAAPAWEQLQPAFCCSSSFRAAHAKQTELHLLEKHQRVLDCIQNLEMLQKQLLDQESAARGEAGVAPPSTAGSSHLQGDPPQLPNPLSKPHLLRRASMSAPHGLCTLAEEVEPFVEQQEQHPLSPALTSALAQCAQRAAISGSLPNQPLKVVTSDGDLQRYQVEDPELEQLRAGLRMLQVNKTTSTTSSSSWEGRQPQQEAQQQRQVAPHSDVVAPGAGTTTTTPVVQHENTRQPAHLSRSASSGSLLQQKSMRLDVAPEAGEPRPRARTHDHLGPMLHDYRDYAGDSGTASTGTTTTARDNEHISSTPGVAQQDPHQSRFSDFSLSESLSNVLSDLGCGTAGGRAAKLGGGGPWASLGGADGASGILSAASPCSDIANHMSMLCGFQPRKAPQPFVGVDPDGIRKGPVHKNAHPIYIVPREGLVEEAKKIEQEMFKELKEQGMLKLPEAAPPTPNVVAENWI
ncbi:unnamed protein product [Amoebophrya sp. A120]|nr:unnamed protein product [Amoebophrya sp. A120]|eukprot:GSA120T00000896001.1